MALRQRSAEAAVVDRIQQHRKPRKPAPPNREALSVVRGVVERSASVDDAITAVKAVAAAWTGIDLATRNAVSLLIAILELSASTEEALATFAMLHYDGSLLKPLSEIRSWIGGEFPDARMRIVPGDDVSAAYLDIFVPADDYPAFWTTYTRIRDWVIDHMLDLSRIIQVVPRPASPVDV